MKNHRCQTGLLLAAALLTLLVLASGCGDDPSAPAGRTYLEQLVGDWAVITVTADTLTHELPDGNAYRYFNATGASCEMWRTAYGYSALNLDGQVDERLRVLTEQHPDFDATWRLGLSLNADTLSLILIEPDSLGIDSYTLIKVDDAPEATCFE